MQRVQIAGMILAGAPVGSPKQPAGVADPLAPIAGRSVTGWVIDALVGASVRRIAVVGDPSDPIEREEMTSRSDRALIDWITPVPKSDSIETIGRAVDRLIHDFTQRENTHLLLLAAEAPQVESSELRALVGDHIESGASASVLGATRTLPTDLPIDPIVSYLDDGQVGSIVEPLVAGGRSIFGAVLVQAALLVPAIRRVTPSGWRQGPLIHDALVALEEAGHTVNEIPRSVPLHPIDSAVTRAPVEAELRRRIVSGWLERGVVFEDPDRVTIDATVTIGHDVRIRPGTVLEGATVVGDGAVIGPNSHLVDTIVGTAAVMPSVVTRGVEVAAHEVLTPFSVLGEPSS
jgi:bifunctional UDP-N-acetylglucosamine pyrophosphorylase/glucosamine-1-phosphate N-acetyltransferase